jgi:pimeloyl-ACP methyl ester carboxylesterase
VLAARLAPRYRVLSLSPRASVAYQVSAADLVGALDQFGFAAPVLVGEGHGCLAALLISAWYPSRVAGLVLINAASDPPAHTPEARALTDCPPDWARLRGAVRCRMLDATGPGDVEAFVTALP